MTGYADVTDEVLLAGLAGMLAWRTAVSGAVHPACAACALTQVRLKVINYGLGSGCWVCCEVVACQTVGCVHALLTLQRAWRADHVQAVLTRGTS